MSDNKELVVEIGSNGRAGQIVFSGARGALVFEKFGEMVDFSIYMSKSDRAVPAFLRGNPGACMAIVVQASEWGFSPFAVARMAYVVNDQVAYMSQLIHAVIEKRAPLKGRLRPTYAGEGLDRQITITGYFVNEVEPLVYTSPKIRDIKVKNSPLWTGDPDQQLFYFGSRAWGRRYCPEILFGVYADDELPGQPTQNIGAHNAKDVTPQEETLQHRLSAKAATGAGFDPDGVTATLNEASGRVPAPQNSPDASRTVPGAQTAVSEPTPPAGIIETAVDNSPTGSAAGIGTQAQETVAAHPTADATVEPPRRRGRPPKAAIAEGSQVSSGHDSEESTPASAPLASDTIGAASDRVPTVEPDTDDESSTGPLPVEVAPPQSPAPETVAGDDPATVENFPDDDIPTFVDRVPDPPVELPEVPTHARYYPGYVRKMLEQPGMSDEATVRLWWGSMDQKRLRNGLIDYGPEIAQKTMDIVTSHLKKIMGI